MHDYYLVLYKFLLKWPNGYFIAPKARQKLYDKRPLALCKRATARRAALSESQTELCNLLCRKLHN